MKDWTIASFPLAILLSLAALTFWLRQAIQLPEILPADKTQHVPDTIIEQFRAITLDVKGRPLHRLEAAKLLHFPDDDTIEILSPRLHYTEEDQPPLTMSAQRGTMTGEGDRIDLHEDVLVEQAAVADNPGWVAHMTHLTAYPNERRAESDAGFVFLQGAARLSGTAFRLDQGERTLKLLTGIRGTFPPATFATPVSVGPGT